MVRRILITGGAGYLGGAVVDALHTTLPEVYVKVYDSLRFEKHYLKQAHFERGDIRDRNRLLKTIEGEDFDTIIWLAGMVGDPICNKFPDEAKEINAGSVRWLASVAGDRRIIFPSTASTYGSNKKTNLTENDDTNPLSIYAENKLEAESYLQDSNAIIFRLGTLYGLGDKFARPRFDLVVNVMTASMIQEKRLYVRGGDQMRPLVHVKDVARIMCNAAMHQRVHGIFNIAKYNMSISNLAAIIQDTLGYGEIIMTDREQAGLDARDYSVSTEKFDRVFRLPLIYPLDRAIAEMAHAIEQGRIKNFKDPIYNNLLSPESNNE
jgi:nucleoside-diphosphate-sugar epimerase